MLRILPGRDVEVEHRGKMRSVNTVLAKEKKKRGLGGRLWGHWRLVGLRSEQTCRSLV